MRSLFTLIMDIVLWVYWYPFRKLVQILPINWLTPLSRAVGLGIALVSRRWRRNFNEVMARTPALTALPNRRPWVISAFQDLLHNELEMLVFPKMTSRNIGSFVRWRGKEHLDQGLEKGRGVMLIFAHFGANQMFMPAVGYSGYKMCQMNASPLDWKGRLKPMDCSRMVQKSLELRWEHVQSLPVQLIDIFGSLRGAYSCLARNEVLGIAMDGAGGKDGIEVDFLGTKALFSTGAMRIAAKTRCVVLPAFMVRDEKGVNEMIIAPPLKELASKDDKEGLKDAIQQLAHLLEGYVIAQPSHYLHFLAVRRMSAEKEDEPPFLLDSMSHNNRRDDDR